MSTASSNLAGFVKSLEWDLGSRPKPRSTLRKTLSATLFFAAALLGVATWLTSSLYLYTPELHWAVGFGEDQRIVALAVACLLLAGVLQLTEIPFRRLVSATLGLCALGSYVWTVADAATNGTYISVGPGWYLLLAAVVLASACPIVQLFVR